NPSARILLSMVARVRPVDQHVAIGRGDQPRRDPTDANIVDVVESFVGLDLIERRISTIWRRNPGLWHRRNWRRAVLFWTAFARLGIRDPGLPCSASLSICAMACWPWDAISLDA